MSTELYDRKKMIFKLLMEDDSISVAQLAERLSVSAVTIRADLSQLEDEGLLTRTRGGATPSFHPAILARKKQNRKTKATIAKCAVSLIEDGDTIMIGVGTTTALIAKYLLGRRNIHIVTNNTLLLPYVRMNPSIRVTLIGGEFRPSEEGMIGPLAIRALEQFHVTKAFLGVDGISLKQGLTAHVVETAELINKMAKQASQVVVLTDSGKFGHSGFARITGLEDVDVLITDTGLDESFKVALSDLGVKVLTPC